MEEDFHDFNKISCIVYFESQCWKQTLFSSDGTTMQVTVMAYPREVLDTVYVYILLEYTLSCDLLFD